jgi:hypothetical protein
MKFILMVIACFTTRLEPVPANKSCTPALARRMVKLDSDVTQLKKQ